MAPEGESQTVETYTGEQIQVTHIGTQGEGARFEIEAEDGRRWRLDVSREGEYEVVTSWNADGELDDVPVAEWMDAVVSRMRA